MVEVDEVEPAEADVREDDVVDDQPDARFRAVVVRVAAKAADIQARNAGILLDRGKIRQLRREIGDAEQALLAQFFARYRSDRHGHVLQPFFATPRRDQDFLADACLVYDVIGRSCGNRRGRWRRGWRFDVFGTCRCGGQKCQCGRGQRRPPKSAVHHNPLSPIILVGVNIGKEGLPLAGRAKSIHAVCAAIVSRPGTASKGLSAAYNSY